MHAMSFLQHRSLTVHQAVIWWRWKLWEYYVECLALVYVTPACQEAECCCRSHSLLQAYFLMVYMIHTHLHYTRDNAPLPHLPNSAFTGFACLLLVNIRIWQLKNF